MPSRKSTMDKEEAREQLRAAFPPGSVAYTTLEKVSASGMTRHIGLKSLYVEKQYRATKANGGGLHRTREAAGPRARVEHVPGILNQTWAAAALLGYRVDDNDGGMIVSGCGMDMGFHVVYSLAAALYGHKDRAPYSISQRWI